MIKIEMNSTAGREVSVVRKGYIMDTPTATLTIHATSDDVERLKEFEEELIERLATEKR